jgi:hypothetical protein
VMTGSRCELHVAACPVAANGVGPCRCCVTQPHNLAVIHLATKVWGKKSLYQNFVQDGFFENAR